MKSTSIDEIQKESYLNFKPVLSSQLIIELLKNDYRLLLVGGAVRDFILTGELVKDIDIEFHHSKYLPNHIEKILKDLNLKYEKLPFGIFRIQISEFEIELAPPRVEKIVGNPPYGHSDFEADTFGELEIDIAVKRRDFSINSMMFLINAETVNSSLFKLIDPLNGFDDLKNKKIKNCSQDFFLDPVRFLRLIRFSEKTQFQIDPELISNLRLFNLSQCTPHHFLKEWEKCPTEKFVEKVFELIKSNNIPYPDEWECLVGFSQVLGRERDFYAFQAFKVISIDADLIKSFQSFFSMKRNLINAFRYFLESIEIVKIDLQLPENIMMALEDEMIMEQLKRRHQLISHLDFFQNLKFNDDENRLFLHIKELKKRRQAIEVSKEEYNSVPNDKRWLFPLFKAISGKIGN